MPPASTFLIDIPLPGRFFTTPAMIVAAHPDDEVLGLGAVLSRFHNLRAIVHVTDGAPRRGSDAADAGANSWEEYAALRRREFESAMQRADVRGARYTSLGFPDQEASYHLVALARQLASLFQRFRPAMVFTHSYEGGHPDHDACAAAVCFARFLLHRNAKRPGILEFASYHRAQNGGLETEQFVGRSPRVWRHSLTEQERQIKRNLVSAYTSQQRVLCQFPLRAEPVRVAPQYDFRKPPHAGRLFYEDFDWGITGPNWRRLATGAITSLDFSHSL
jgi:LmbE family N-acetylglucosaminyl deacetylase